MKYRIFISFIAALSFSQLASATPETQKIRQLAAESSTALASGNYARLVDLTYPKIVEMMGGREKMIETIRRGTEEMKAQGGAILSAEPDEPTRIVTVKGKQFAIVPMMVRVQMPEGTLSSKSFLIAVSEDRGKTWKFIDGAGIVRDPSKEKEKLAQVLPDFPSQLTLPAYEKPIFDPK